MNSIYHKIAGIIFRTESDAWLPVLSDPKQYFGQFQIGEAEPEVLHRIHKVAPDSLILSPLPQEDRRRLSHVVHCSPGGLASPLLHSHLVRSKLRTSLESPEHLRISLFDDWVIISDFSRCVLDLFYWEESGGYDVDRQECIPEHYIAANFRQIFSTFLSSFSALLMHSAGVVRNGTTALFVAPDEGGKSTVARHAMGESILNDDQIVLRHEGNVVVAHGTPFGGMTSGPHRSKLGGIFLLDQARCFELVPLHPADLVQCIWTENQNYTFLLPKSLRARAFETLCNACYQAPAYRMRFAGDFVDWDAIDAVMAG